MWTWLIQQARGPLTALWAAPRRLHEKQRAWRFSRQLRREMENRRAKMAEDRARDVFERARLEASAEDYSALVDDD